MMKTSLKPLIRRIVLTTYVPPFAPIYNFYYWLVSRIVLRTLKKFSGVKAVYLRRGCAKGEMLPGVSDIDFGVIVERMDEEEKKSLRRAYEKVASCTFLPDSKYLDVFDAETLHKSHDISRKRKHFLLFLEGKATWKLLYGKDYLVSLPTIPIQKLYGGLHQEIKTWWRTFCQRIFGGDKNHAEVPIRNSVCYKTVSEILKMNLAFYHGTLIFSRSDALERAKPHLSDKDRVFINRLEALERRRFLINDRNIVEETKDFLLSFLDQFYEKIHTHDYARPLKGVTHRVDCPSDELIRNDREHAIVTRRLYSLKKKWSDTFKGAYLVSGVYFNLDEQMLMIEVDPARLPTFEELTEVCLLERDIRLRLSSHIHLYLLMPHAAFNIDGIDLKGVWRSILTPSSNPDIFDLLGRAEFALDGTKYNSHTGPIWTTQVKDFISERKNETFDRLQLSKINRKDTISFLRSFWKAAQLCLIARSMKTDEIFYPLTIPSIKRGLSAQGVSLPSSLQSLEDAYRDVVDGKNCNISALIPAAVNYLKDIDS